MEVKSITTAITPKLNNSIKVLKKKSTLGVINSFQPLSHSQPLSPSQPLSHLSDDDVGEEFAAFVTALLILMTEVYLRHAWCDRTPFSLSHKRTLSNILAQV